MPKKRLWLIAFVTLLSCAAVLVRPHAQVQAKVAPVVVTTQHLRPVLPLWGKVEQAAKVERPASAEE